MEVIKNIISGFIKKSPAEVSKDTIINNSVIPGSILIHRMYAAIAKAGYPLENYNGINTYGDLLVQLGIDVPAASTQEKWQLKTPASNGIPVKSTSARKTGIDIESIDNLPRTNDFREEMFYKTNFTEREIAYAILKKDPYETLAGIFAAKEAICKADPHFRQYTFNNMEIIYDDEGAPLFAGFSISVSHTKGLAVAVAIKDGVKGSALNHEKMPVEVPAMVNPQGRKINYLVLVISIASLAISLFLLFILKRN